MDLTKLHLHWGASQHKGKSYRSYSLACAYRENGKNRKKIVLKLGKLSDQEAEYWRDFLRTAKDSRAFFTTTEDIVINQHLAYLDVAVVSTVWDEWQLDKVFPRDNTDISTATVARILSINRVTTPKAKSQTPGWCRNTILPWLLNFASNSINSGRVFRELTRIEDAKDDLCSHLFTLLQQKYPQSMSKVFYDLSSTTFTGSKCTLMKWGHCKEGYKNHVVLAIVVNQCGLPFYWEVLPGGTADSKTITWLLGRLKKRFRVISTTVVFDRGMVSDDNLALLEEAQVKYISAMDKNQIENITDIAFASSFSYLDPNIITEQANCLENFTKLNDSTYYREIKVEGERRYILCFNPQLFTEQRRTREQVIEDFRGFVSGLNKVLSDAKGDRTEKNTLKKFNKQLTKKKLIGFVEMQLTGLRLTQKDKTGADV